MKRTRAREYVYCLVRSKDGSWLWLNRAYKPFGIGLNRSSPWVDYDTCAGIRVSLTDEDLRRLSYRPCRGEDQIWLTDSSQPADDPRSRRAYAERLALLDSVCEMASEA